MKFKKSLSLADKLGARYALIIGEDEVASGTFTREAPGRRRTEKAFAKTNLLEYLAAEAWQRKGTLVLDTLGNLKRTNYCGALARGGRR